MTVTSNSVANQAIQLIGDNQPPVTGYAPDFDDSTTGLALQKLYVPCMRTVARQFGFDFERNIVTLTETGNTPPIGWAHEYTYPINGVEVWQLMPPEISDLNNPLAINWSVGNTLVDEVQTKVIWSDQANAVAVYANTPDESTWDPLFHEAFVRLLSSELAAATAGKPQMSQGLLQSGAAFEELAETRSG